MSTTRRHRAHHCERLTAGALRPQVAPGAVSHRLADGTELPLRWRPVRGCFGNGEGQSLQLVCPRCAAAGRVLWRPPGEGWGCWRCVPISHRSHRRPGAGRGRPKPTRWRLDQITAEQRRIADLLGLQHWPPQRLFWSWRTLPLEARRPDAPRISRHREQALHWRLCALETLRLSLLIPQIDATLRDWGQELPPWERMDQQAASAQRMVAATGWAMRRPSRDLRTPRGGVSACAGENTAAAVCDCNGSEVGESEDLPLADLNAIGSVTTSPALDS